MMGWGTLRVVSVQDEKSEMWSLVEWDRKLEESWKQQLQSSSMSICYKHRTHCPRQGVRTQQASAGHCSMHTK